MKFALACLLALFTSIWSASPLATPILQGTRDAATGFSNFAINDSLYNIHFTGNVSYLDLFEQEIPFFFGDQQGAQDEDQEVGETSERAIDAHRGIISDG